MRHFQEIVALAAERLGGAAALEAALATSRSRSPAEIAVIPDDRVLAAMTRLVFQSGFAWKVIDAKWAGFEVAFDGFSPPRCAAMSEDRFDALLKDASIVRNGAKIRSVVTNARFVLELAESHGSAAGFLAGWPDDDYVGLLDVLKKRASRLGGDAGPRFLRSIGKPAFILTQDVAAALLQEQVLTRPPSGKRDLAIIQAAFNQWSSESGLDLTAISRVLAMSAGKVATGPLSR